MKPFNFKTCIQWLLKTKRTSHSEGGYVLVIVMGMVMVLSGLFVTTGLVSKVDKASSKANEEDTTGYYAAEAGLNLRAQAIREKFQGYNQPAGTSPTSISDCRNSTTGAAIDTMSATNDFGCKSYDGKFQAINNQENGTLSDRLKDIKVSTYVEAKGSSNIKISDGESFAGLQAQEYKYDVISSALSNQLINSRYNPTASLRMSFKSRLVPLFQFAAFYENDLDFYRPAPMTLNGPIHTNGDLYLNSGGPDLQINGQLSSAGKMYRGVKNTDETCNPSGSFTGNVKVHDPIKTVAGIDTAVSNNFVTIPCSGSLLKAEITTDASYNNVFVNGGTAVNNWNGQIRPGIPRLTVPKTSFLDTKLPDSTDKYDYWNKADLRIALRLDPTTTTSSSNYEAPASIEVVDENENNDSTKTASLLGSTCQPTSTTLAGGPYTTSSTSITVASASSFNVGDAIRIVKTGTGAFDDFDENVIQSKSGNTLTLRRPLGRQAISSTQISGSVTVQKAIVWTSKTFYNYREKTLANSSWTTAQQGRLIRMLNVDVQGLLSCAGQSTGNLMGGKEIDESTDGGLVWHFTVIGPNSENDVTKATPDNPNSYGIRLYNGAHLASRGSDSSKTIKGLTIASDQAIYVQGDYNCRSSDSTNGVGGGVCGDSTQTRNKRPAAILADSINILSNSSRRDDSYTCTGYSANYNASTCNQSNTTAVTARPTSNTVINAAFLAGVDVTQGTADSGGLNNYPRLHEYWPGSTLTYRGSMVSLGKARRVNGPFGAVGDTYNIYYAPTRNWDYDNDFDNANNLPPLSPRFVYLKQERYSRDFEQQASLSFSLPNLVAMIFPWLK